MALITPSVNVDSIRMFEFQNIKGTQKCSYINLHLSTAETEPPTSN